MTMNVVVLPGPILCALCGNPVTPMGKISPPEWVCIVQCDTAECQNYKRPHQFPLMGSSLQNEIEIPKIITLQ